jgi:hypothetical protein
MFALLPRQFECQHFSDGARKTLATLLRLPASNCYPYFLLHYPCPLPVLRAGVDHEEPEPVPARACRLKTASYYLRSPFNANGVRDKIED